MQKNKKIREAKKRNFRSDEAVNTIENCRSHSLIDESGFREPSERISARSAHSRISMVARRPFYLSGVFENGKALGVVG